MADVVSTKPTRTSLASYAIIKARVEDVDKYLLQLNPHRGTFNFISGHCEPEDRGDFEQTIIREIQEELPPLKYSEDFVVEPVLADPIEAVHFSERFQEWTAYRFMVYQMFFLKPFSKYQMVWEGNPMNKWFTEVELWAGVSSPGDRITTFPVHEIMKRIPGGLKALGYSFKSAEVHFKKLLGGNG